jgi:hypothetical protein
MRGRLRTSKGGLERRWLARPRIERRKRRVSRLNSLIFHFKGLQFNTDAFIDVRARPNSVVSRHFSLRLLEAEAVETSLAALSPSPSSRRRRRRLRWLAPLLALRGLVPQPATKAIDLHKQPVQPNSRGAVSALSLSLSQHSTATGPAAAAETLTAYYTELEEQVDQLPRTSSQVSACIRAGRAGEGSARMGLGQGGGIRAEQREAAVVQGYSCAILLSQLLENT